MAYLLVQLRPVGDKRGSYYLRFSDRPRDSTYRDKGVAFSAAMCLSSQYRAILLLDYDHNDRVAQTYKFNQGEWREMKMLK